MAVEDLKGLLRMLGVLCMACEVMCDLHGDEYDLGSRCSSY